MIAAVMFFCLSVVSCEVVKADRNADADDEYALISDKVKHSYINDSGKSVKTEDILEFEENIDPDDQILVLFILGYEIEECNCKKGLDIDSTPEEVDDAKAKHNEEMRKQHSSKNYEFISASEFSSESEDYNLTVSEYSPYVAVTFDNYSLYKKYYNKVISSAGLDIVSSVIVEIVYPNVNC